jgi:hypothetical protein
VGGKRLASGRSPLLDLSTEARARVRGLQDGCGDNLLRAPGTASTETANMRRKAVEGRTTPPPGDVGPGAVLYGPLAGVWPSTLSDLALHFTKILLAIRFKAARLSLKSVPDGQHVAGCEPGQ